MSTVVAASRAEFAPALRDLRLALPDLGAAIVATVDGLPVAHDLAAGDPSSIAAMAATAAGLSRRIVDDLALGSFSEAVVRAGDGYFVVYGAGPRAVLAATAAAGANLGRVHLEARRCAARIAAVLEQMPA